MRNFLKGGVIMFQTHSVSVTWLLVVGALGSSSLACSKEESGDPAGERPAASAAATTACPVTVSVGSDHACATLSDGQLACWGLARAGSFGSADLRGVSSAVKVRAAKPFVDVAVGYGVTCGVAADMSVVCTGDNRQGLLGNPAAGDVTSTWTTPLGFDGGVSALSLGLFTACARTRDGSDVRCWGGSESGIAGAAPVAPTPVPIALNASATSSLSVGAVHACALERGGGVVCWGANDSGALGNGSLVASPSAPVAVDGLTDAVAITVGASHSCALRRGGTVACWGNSSGGRVGSLAASPAGTTTDERLADAPFTRPVTVPELEGVRSIQAGDDFTCAVRDDGSTHCWGVNARGQLGDGSSTSSARPTQVFALAKGTRALAAGGSTACAVTDACSVVCWGDGSSGKLGDPNLPLSRVPRRVAID